MKLKFRFLIVAFLMLFVGIGISNTLVVSGGNTDYYVSDNAVETLSSTEIRTIQTKLKKWGYYTGTVDGIYGAKTTSAVKYFQRKNGLTADGIVGKKTAAAMGINLGGSSTIKQNSSD